MSIISQAFKRLHYPTDVIAQCLRWYLSYALSLRDLEEIMKERGIDIDHSTLHRWVIRLTPLLDQAFKKHKKTVGLHWRMDETYIKVKGQWKYLYRAVDSQGKTIDFLLTAKRNARSALRLLHQAICNNEYPHTVTIDHSPSNHAALNHLNKEVDPTMSSINIRQNKYLNNRVEQDHRFIKRRIRPMLGFKSFWCAKMILSGIEWMHMLRKGQLNASKDETTSIGLFYLLMA
ncbi:IS6 family transposase (plasmid) [Acinetobacter sp. ESL0695]|uniref:IS6 family transposase n=1 Tax=Acinetobacter sp. ESL0695 TaxID=2983215 RepID=UPI0023F3D2F3|nr:IS6 family transposase [Acinetobacter sp. ESL0695]WEV50127.1 IS6 family transposase [Acinetobacter sp. ESL0695]